MNLRDHEIVICRYREDIAWAEGRNAIIYNHGEPIQTSLRQVMRPNVGREIDAFFTHIIDRWDSLADFTLFTHAGLDHAKGHAIEEWFNTTAEIVVPHLVAMKDWDENFRIKHNSPWLENMQAGRLKPAKLNLDEWFRKWIGITLRDQPGYQFSCGNMIGVTRERIKRRPLQLYRDIRDASNYCDDPEETHYMERMYLYLWGWPAVALKNLSEN